MTGLNLESFLLLLRADVGAWVTLGIIGVVLALMTWTSWGSRRALRKCLVLSVAAHVGLVIYGSTLPLILMIVHARDKKTETSQSRIRQIRVSPWVEGSAPGGKKGTRGRPSSLADAWDRSLGELALAESPVGAPRPELEGPKAIAEAPKAVETPALAIPDVNPPVPSSVKAPAIEAPAPPPARVAPSAPDEIARPVLAGANGAEGDAPPVALAARDADRRAAAGARPREHARADLPAFLPAAPPPDVEGPVPSPPLAGFIAEDSREGQTMPVAGDPNSSGVSNRELRRPGREAPAVDAFESDVRFARPERANAAAAANSRRLDERLGPLALSRAVPSGLPNLPDIQGAIGGRPLSDVPEVYRSRLDPNRSVLAQRAGATPASEQAVERSLDWLARHQDADGRWNAGIARSDDGTPIKGDDDYTVHCPPGEMCIGECLYWEADTALTGLSLLAYLGAGYTHTDGKYADTVDRGLEFLRGRQRPDGDLRGDSKAVGMYCHAMATLALCEAFALTGDERLRDPVERAVAFLIRARARDGLAWRYAPGADRGDTSILGWVVMVMKSAKVVGIPVPPTIQRGAITWLERVSSGPAHGLASYLPEQPPTPTMTAEAWVCRQFLGIGGPGETSREAARSLLENGPDRPGRDSFNLYYWYYGTLAMFQHGGDPWVRWNGQVRDQLVRRQRLDGHRAGSWDPDTSRYGVMGGRIYSTALATLTLEVYYRYLRLYDEPSLSPTPPPPAPGLFSDKPRRNRG